MQFCGFTDICCSFVRFYCLWQWLECGGEKNPSEENPNGKKLMTLEQAASAAAYM